MWEAQALLLRLDALWADYLADIATLERAAQTRAFAQLDPLDEFRLEAAQLFARLLRDFRLQAAAAVLGPVDADAAGMRLGADADEAAAGAAAGAVGGGGGGGGGEPISLEEVAWAGDWVKAVLQEPPPPPPPPAAVEAPGGGAIAVTPEAEGEAAGSHTAHAGNGSGSGSIRDSGSGSSSGRASAASASAELDALAASMGREDDGANDIYRLLLAKLSEASPEKPAAATSEANRNLQERMGGGGGSSGREDE
jgi:hypothetical protein